MPIDSISCEIFITKVNTKNQFITIQSDIDYNQIDYRSLKKNCFQLIEGQNMYRFDYLIFVFCEIQVINKFSPLIIK